MLSGSSYLTTLTEHCFDGGREEGTDAWSIELAEFLGTNPTRFRAVLAGRDLSQFSGNRVELSPLSQHERSRYLSSCGVTAAQRSALAHDKSFRQYIHNTGWLFLVSKYLAQVPGNTPDSFRELMDGTITQQIGVIAATHPEFPDGLIVKVAEEIAIQLAKSPAAYGVSKVAQVQFLSASGCDQQRLIELVIDETHPP